MMEKDIQRFGLEFCKGMTSNGQTKVNWFYSVGHVILFSGPLKQISDYKALKYIQIDYPRLHQIPSPSVSHI